MDRAEIAKLAIDIIPSLAANGLTALISRTGRFFSRNRAPKIAERVKKSQNVASILQKATASIARKLPDDSKLDLLRVFLISPELDAITRQIYCSKVTTQGTHDHLGSIRKEFLLSIGLHLNLDEKQAESVGTEVFEVILETCGETLSRSINEGSLPALEAKSALRHNIMLDQMEAIRRNLELLGSKTGNEIREILAFEKKFRFQVGDRHSHITPPNLSAAKKVSLGDLYVANTFTRNTRKDTHIGFQFTQHISSDEFIESIARSVVLGSPGGGKSTLTHYICHQLATRYSERLIGGRLLTPILVVLRDFGAEKKARPCSILEFIELTAKSKYQVNAPEGAFEYLLLNGRALVVFDGLDELLDTSYRREISADVESFATLYPATPIVVTSREVGYDQAPLDEKKFSVHYINQFNDHQVKEYVQKWFASDEDLSSEQNLEMASAFLSESASVRDLRANPLILGLMCNIYRGETYIPRNRPGVYEKCALMLFDRWDRSRHIDVQFSFEDKLSPVMKHLAYWIYSDANLQTGVTESKLVNKATEYLHNRLYEDEDLARKTARDFIEFCRGRAWIFTDIGSTGDGELLYQFTHRTFLEYFTAAQLVRTHPRPSDLAPVLIPHIAKKEWDIVAQLAFQLQNNNVEGAGDELLAAVVATAKKEDDNTGSGLYSFAARCLEFMLPNRQTVREIAEEVLAFCLHAAVQQFHRGKECGHSDATQRAQDLIRDLVHVAIENRPTVADVIRQSLATALTSSKHATAIAAFDCMWFFAESIEAFGHQGSKLSDYWSDIRREILGDCSVRAKQLAQLDSFVAKILYFNGSITLSELLDWHGLGELYTDTTSLIFSRRYMPIADLLITPHDKARYAYWASQLVLLGSILLTAQPPWVHTRALGSLKKSRFANWTQKWPTDSSVEVIFGLFVVIAVLLESGENRQSLPETLLFIRVSRNPSIALIRDLLLIRYVADVKLAETLATFGFTTDQEQLIRAWGNKDISFVEGAKRRKK
jgi:hypothetical protein